MESCFLDYCYLCGCMSVFACSPTSYPFLFWWLGFNSQNPSLFSLSSYADGPSGGFWKWAGCGNPWVAWCWGDQNSGSMVVIVELGPVVTLSCSCSLASQALIGSLTSQNLLRTAGAGWYWDVLGDWVCRSLLKSWCHRSCSVPWETTGTGVSQMLEFMGPSWKPRFVGAHWESRATTVTWVSGNWHIPKWI